MIIAIIIVGALFLIGIIGASVDSARTKGILQRSGVTGGYVPLHRHLSGLARGLGNDIYCVCLRAGPDLVFFRAEKSLARHFGKDVAGDLGPEIARVPIADIRYVVPVMNEKARSAAVDGYWTDLIFNKTIGFATGFRSSTTVFPAVIAIGFGNRADPTLALFGIERGSGSNGALQFAQALLPEGASAILEAGEALIEHAEASEEPDIEYRLAVALTKHLAAKIDRKGVLKRNLPTASRQSSRSRAAGHNT